MTHFFKIIYKETESFRRMDNNIQGELLGHADPKRVQIISPANEISAYETLWLKYRSVHQMAELFKKYNHQLPSRVAAKEKISKPDLEETKRTLRHKLPFTKYSALFFSDFEYPERLTVAKNPPEVIYYQGALDILSDKKIVSIVGARKPTKEGLIRAKKLAQLLVKEGFTIMSGLAEGIDTAAHSATLEAGGKTIAVIGTPLSEVYPKANEKLQQTIVQNHLLVSQVPFCFYSQQSWRENRFFFPERNIVMSALSNATIIVEASDTSGSLHQARAAIQQGRKLFILDSCFKKGYKWPDAYVKRGAHRVASGEEILRELKRKPKI